MADPGLRPSRRSPVRHSGWSGDFPERTHSFRHRLPHLQSIWEYSWYEIHTVKKVKIRVKKMAAVVVRTLPYNNTELSFTD